MVDRVLIGDKGGVKGIWMSKPGFDVSTAGEEDMLLSSSRGDKIGQIMQMGVAAGSGNPSVIFYSLGTMSFYPAVFLFEGGSLYATYFIDKNNPETIEVVVSVDRIEIFHKVGLRYFIAKEAVDE